MARPAIRRRSHGSRASTPRTARGRVTIRALPFIVPSLVSIIHHLVFGTLNIHVHHDLPPQGFPTLVDEVLQLLRHTVHLLVNLGVRDPKVVRSFEFDDTFMASSVGCWSGCWCYESWLPTRGTQGSGLRFWPPSPFCLDGPTVA